MYTYQTTFIPYSVVTPQNHKGKQHIAVIGGGMSAEREVSLVSSKAVIQALITNGYKVTFIDMGADIATKLEQLKPDIVYNSLHGTYGEDGCLQGLLNIMKIPYTHSGVLASSLAFNKLKSKELFIANNLKTPAGIIVKKSDNIQDDPLPRPFVIKPLSQGSSIGIEIIFTEDKFNFSNYHFPYGDQIIVEQYIAGREMQIALLNDKAFGVLEIELLKRRFYDYDTKYTDGFARHILPASIPDNIYRALLTTAEHANSIICCKGLARVEFIYKPDSDELFILELNTHPGMTPLSICPEILAFHGINFNELIEELVRTANYEQ